ncbi:hypothetical protein LIA77_00039 [Sarocladium implicatum]|nr:hypothetical protein LIA77_00039 [Sarocladium implicatum]
MQALVDHLNLQKYHLLGTSGGTGFTLACAKEHHKSRLKGVGICAGIGPVQCGFDSMEEKQRKALEAWRDHPTEFKAFYDTEYVPLAQSEDPSILESKLRDEFKLGFAGKDRENMLREDNFNQAVASMREAWIQGAWAHAHGMALHWQPWGFRLEDVAFPGIKLWYGEKDVSTTPVMGRYMAERLPSAEYIEFSGESHLTVWKERILRKMINDLVGDSDANRRRRKRASGC